MDSAQGLYDPAYQHDACGIAFIARLSGVPSHDTVAMGLTALDNLDHRVLADADPETGDGAGITIQVPDDFLQAVLDFDIPDAGRYAAGLAFLPVDAVKRAAAKRMVEYIAAEEGLVIHGWRPVPVNAATLSAASVESMPHLEQLFVSAPGEPSGIDLDRLVYPLRQRARAEAGVSFASLSARTLVYKGMLTPQQLADVFPDLLDERVRSALCLVHSRFATTAARAWQHAQPHRLIAHDGDVTTIRGNRAWMRAREGLLATDAIGGDLGRLLPVCTPGGSDSASFDEVLELLHLGGRSLPHAMAMMIPEAWEKNAELDLARRDFYSFHAGLMEPWDGPATVAFTDGTLVGAVVDRGGSRPGRYLVTEDGLVVFASRAGVLDIPEDTITRKGRLQPGRMLLADLDAHRVIDDDEIKGLLAGEQPYGEWVRAGRINLDDLPERQHVVYSHASVMRRQQVFGYTNEELRLIVASMANTGAGPIGSMGADAPVAALSDRPRLLFDYFAQTFAQVTNPPLDALREGLSSSLTATFGPEGNLLGPGPDSCRQIVIGHPILDSDQMAKLVRINRDGSMPDYQAHIVRGLYDVEGGGPALKQALDDACRGVSEAIGRGCRTIILSDRHSNVDKAPIPSLLLTAAVHHHLVRERARTHAGLIVEAGDVREAHHVALLIGYGAAAVNPYLCFETAEDLARNEWFVTVDPEHAVANVRAALGEGLLAIMSRIGVSMIPSYTGAQLFEATGLSAELVEEYFEGTTSRLGGIGLDEIAAEVAARHDHAYSVSKSRQPHRGLDVGGEYRWRREGPPHGFDPVAITRLRDATRAGDYEAFKRYTARVDDQSARTVTLRGLLDFADDREPVPLDEVEPAAAIVKRFSTGAMSYGAISQEAHETLAVAMNRLGARSNCGEGGEDPARLRDPERCSAIKQVASGRFGVTGDYLAHARDIQIKIAQGAQPGEGGVLPAPKVYPWIAATRHSTPGVGLMSPPSHHDVRSMDDLRQLIHDLGSANPDARVHVKLASQAGVGAVAAGAVKAGADVVWVSGHDGGTGAAPLDSIEHAGASWEVGLAETQQTLVREGLRDRAVVAVDGQLRTGRDVLVATLLGAQEYGFGTAPLVVLGCGMTRLCHLDTCPAGIATQDPKLRAAFSGEVEHVVRFFEFLAAEVREWLARLGFRSIEEAVGRCEALRARELVGHPKAARLDLGPVLHRVEPPSGPRPAPATDDAVDPQLIALAEPALARGEPVTGDLSIGATDRSVGALLGHAVTVATDGAGLPADTIDLTFRGTAGQSFGAFLPAGVTLRLIGEANDYVGKGLTGGRVTLRPHKKATFAAGEQVIAGDAVGYGSTSGELLIRGQVGERFAVRNSGATIVVEGAGDHACEYMTGGEVLILGPTGRNVAAGMSGGVAWVLDLVDVRLNPELVDPLPCEDADLDRVEELLGEHRDETGSVVAEQLLAAGREELRARLTKIMPRDYARVLDARARGVAAGLGEAEITTMMMEASHD